MDRQPNANRPLTGIAVTGIKPSGTPHLGNYIGMIRPALELARSYRAFYFIADCHALTALPHSASLHRWTYQAAAAWMALGLDPARVTFYRQSDVPEIAELHWILSCVTAKGLLNRAHAYKAAAKANTTKGLPPDNDINAALFNYPVLMAADILLFGAEVVPVGADQQQHLEITRDIASAFNRRYGDVFGLPKAMMLPGATTVTGTDGRKMSKSYRNTIPIFAHPEEMRRRVMRIVTDSKSAAEPKNADRCNVFALYRHVAPPEAAAAWQKRYQNGGAAYAEIKIELADLLEHRFGRQRRAYEALLEDRKRIDRILARGAARAREAAGPVLKKVRRIVGFQRPLSGMRTAGRHQPLSMQEED